MKDFFIVNKNLCISVGIVLAGVLAYMIVKHMMNRIATKNKDRINANRRKRTYVKLFNSIFKYVILIIVCIAVLQVNGVNVTSIIAGLGVASVIAGLALQDALKDIIMGFNIIIDDYFSVGDVLEIGDVVGKVTELGLKTTKLKDVNNGNVFVIANRNIEKALNVSNEIDIDLPLPYEEPIDKMEKLINKMMARIKEIENVDDVVYKGIKDFGESAIFYKIRIYAKPEHKYLARLRARRIIKIELDKANVAIPYTQVAIHNKK